MFRSITLFTFFLTFCTLVLANLLRMVPEFSSVEDSFKPVWLQGLNQAVLVTSDAFPPLFSSVSVLLSLGFPVLLFVMAWWMKPVRTIAVSLSSLLLLLGGLSRVLSNPGWTEKLNLMPQVMDLLIHLLTGVVSLSILLWLYWRTNKQLSVLNRAIGPRKMAGFTFFVVLLQITLGLWMTLNDAGSACSDFPTCSGSWWPPLDYWQGFDPSALNTTYQQAKLEALQAIHWLHRVGAIATSLVVLVLAFLALSPRSQRSIQIAGLYVMLLLSIQMGLGVLQVLDKPIVDVSEWLVAIKLGHSLISVVLLMLVLYIRIHATRLLRQVDIEPVVAELEPEGKVAPTVETPAKEPENLLLRLKGQLYRTRGTLADLTLGKKTIDGDLLQALESRLIMADIGIEATGSIINNLTQSLERNQLKDAKTLTRTVRDNMLSILQPCSQPLQIESKQKPFVILVVGVNGVGKTTTIGKLAKRLQLQGHTVMLAAGDTFRAAAVEQLQTWGERNQIPVVAQHSGADSASVIYDAVQSAQAKGIDVVIADTAGRLQTKSNLMDELSKIKRIMGKLDADAPHEVLLVLDASTGQNALSQVKQFKQAVDLTGIALTKLDGTAKGGMIIALAKRFAVPIRFIGVGEGIDDLQDFDAKRFIDALFSE